MYKVYVCIYIVDIYCVCVYIHIYVWMYLYTRIHSIWEIRTRAASSSSSRLARGFHPFAAKARESPVLVCERAKSRLPRNSVTEKTTGNNGDETERDGEGGSEREFAAEIGSVRETR